MNKKLFLITTLCLFSSSVSWSQGEDIFWNNGVTHYDGEFRYATRHGQGTLTTTYEGWPTRGQGTYTFANGDQYIGEWIYMKTPSFNNVKTNPKVFKDIILQGQGTYTSVNGGQYVGEWANGYPIQGTATFANGSTYVGEFKNGKIEGQGTFTFASGTIESGIWENDEYLGTREEATKIIKEREAKEERERIAREEAKKKYDGIYNACLLDKSSDVDMQVNSLRRAVEETCEAIAEDPSWYEEWKYN